MNNSILRAFLAGKLSRDALGALSYVEDNYLMLSSLLERDGPVSLIGNIYRATRPAMQEIAGNTREHCGLVVRELLSWAMLQHFLELGKDLTCDAGEVPEALSAPANDNDGDWCSTQPTKR